MDQRIVKFIKRHHVMTLATTANGQPWVCQVFYAYHAESGSLIFTSGASTRHIISALENPKVGVSIVLESKVVARLQGVQIEGTLSAGEDPAFRSAFVARFPFIALTLGTLWRVQIVTAKYTDNTLGFGTKLYFPSESLADKE
ncbi:MAG: pyridoxamine 5'-phosphate oxidase family protein [Mucinivorans sp.]